MPRPHPFQDGLTRTLAGVGVPREAAAHIADAGIAAALGNSTVGASLSDVNMAVVLSSEVGGSARRWITSKAAVGGATLQGYALADISSASLNVNGQLVGGALILGAVLVAEWGAIRSASPRRRSTRKGTP